MRKMWKHGTSVFLLVILLLGNVLSVTAYAETGETVGVFNDRVYSFLNLSDNRAIDVPGGNTATGTYLEAYEFSSANPWQRWQIKYVGNGDYELVDMNSGKLLSIPGSSSQTGLQAWIWPRDNTNGQKFRIQRNADGSYTFLSKASNYTKALGWDGNALKQLAADGTSNQKFKMVLAGYVYSIYGADTGTCLDTELSVTSGGRIFENAPRTGFLGQKWKIDYIGNDLYRIMDMYSGLYWSVANNSEDYAEAIQRKAWNNQSGQKFQIRQNSDGTVSFLPQCSRDNYGIVELYNGSLVQYMDEGLSSQSFTLVAKETNEMPNGGYFFASPTGEYYLQQDVYEDDMTEQAFFGGDDYQMWRVKYDADGFFTIINHGSGEYLTSPDSVTNGAVIELQPGFGDDPTNGIYNTYRQRWKITIGAYGRVLLQSRQQTIDSPSLYVSVPTNSTDNTYVLQSTAHAKLWQPRRTTMTELRWQDTNTFCWLACAEMETKTQGYNLYSQWDICLDYFYDDTDGAILETGGTPAQIALACEYYTDNELDYVAYTLRIYSEDNLQKYIDAGDTVIITRGWYVEQDGVFVRAGGHATLITGYYYNHEDGKYRYIINDPWDIESPDTPGIGSRYIRSYDNLICGRTLSVEEDLQDLGFWESVIVLNTEYANTNVTNPCFRFED